MTCPVKLGHLELEFSTYDTRGEEEENSIKASKFSKAQIAFVLKQAEDGTPIGEVCCKAGISDAIFYNWRKKYAGLMPSEMKRLRQLEDENGTGYRVGCLSAQSAAMEPSTSSRPSVAT